MLTRRVWMGSAFALVLVFSITACNTAPTKTSTTDPQDPFAQIDTKLTDEVLEIFAQGDSGKQQAIIKKIQAHPERYAPPVFYFMADILFRSGKKDDATFWFYAGQLRASYDANRCADKYARRAVASLTREFGRPINLYAFGNLDKLETLISDVVAWDRRTPHNYDHRWINLHGLNSSRAAQQARESSDEPVVFSLPPDQWDEIAERTRKEYMASFQKLLARLHNR